MSEPGHDPFDDLGAVPSLEYREPEKKSWKPYFWIAAAFVGCIVGMYFYKPAKFLYAKQWVMREILGIDDGSNDPVSAAAMKLAKTDQSPCAQLLREAASKSAREVRLSNELISIRSCLIFRKQFINMYDYAPRFRDAHAAFPSIWTTETDTEYLQMIVAMNSTWRESEAQALVMRMCPSWKYEITCVGRFLALAMDFRVTGADPNFYKKATTLAELEKFQGYIHYAGALDAIRRQDFSEAGSRLQDAVKAADDIGLKRLIYEAMAELLYLRGGGSGFKDISRAVQKLSDTNKSADDLVDLFNFLAGNGRDRDFARIVNKPSEISGALNTKRYIEYIMIESMRGKHKGLLKNEFFSAVPNYLREHFSLDEKRTKVYQIWQIRYLLATAKFDEGLGLANSYLSTNQNDNVVRHLKGLLIMGSSPSQAAYLRAGMEFQIAGKSRATWESVYAIGIALVGANRGRSLDSVYLGLKNIATKQPQYAARIQMWQELLKAENEITTGHADTALTTINGVLAGNKDLPHAYFLRLSALSATRNHAAHKELRSFLDKKYWTQSSRYREYGDPLGPLVFLE